MVWRLSTKPLVLHNRYTHETTIFDRYWSRSQRSSSTRLTDRRSRQGYDLQAANFSKSATYGTRSLTLNLGLRRSFPWIFTIADLTHAILGADFLRHFNLLVDLRNRSLIDAETHLRVSGITSPIPAPHLIYAALLRAPFTKIFSEYPDIIRPTTKQTVVSEL